MRKENYTKKFFDLLKDLKEQFPTWELSRHISGMLEEYNVNNCWGVSDKELYFALDKYAQALALDDTTDDISRIIQDGINLDAMMAEPTDDEY